MAEALFLIAHALIHSTLDCKNLLIVAQCLGLGDIVHRQSNDNIDKLLAFLKKIDAIHRRPHDKILEPKKRDLSGRGHALFATRFGPLDVLAVIEEGRGYDDLLPDTVEIEFKEHKVRVLSLKTLVELKRRSRDPKDLQRLPVLEETLRQSSANNDRD